MLAPRKTLLVATFVLVLAAGVGRASAEPKNQWPFTRHVDSRALAQSTFHNGVVDVSPRPEPKNEPPFTRIVTPSAAHDTSFTATGSSAGFDWPLAGWVALVALTIVGGAITFRHGVRHARQHPA